MPLLQSVEEGYRSYPASYSVVIGAPSAKVERAGCETHHSPSFSPKVKNVSSYTSNPAYAFTVRKGQIYLCR